MADPLSVAGLVAGLVSLGIQATTGITSYLGAIRNRKDELVAAKRYVDSITGNIQAFNNIQPRLRKHANLSSNVEALLQSCHNEAGSLQNLVHELSTPGVPSRKLKDKFQEKKKDFTYVFHRPDIARIEEKLSRFDGSLQSAIQLLLLDIQILAVEKIDKVQSGSQEMITISQRIDTGVSVIMPEIASLQQPLHAISQSVSSAAAVCSHGQSQIMGAKYSGAVNQNVSLVDDIAQALGVVQNSRFDRLEDMLSRLLSDEQHLSKGQLPDGVDTNRINLSSQENRVARRLLSCPSVLKETTDDLCSILEPETSQSLASVANQTCLCNKRTRRRKTQSRWGPIYLSTEINQIEHHMPKCPLSFIMTSKTSRAYHFSWNYLPGIIDRVIDVSLSWCAGAGGMSISSALMPYNVVDRSRAPAFRLLSALKICTVKGNHSPQHWKELLDECFLRILQLYRQGRASPKDFDAYGYSLAKPIADLLEFIPHCNSKSKRTRDNTNFLRRIMELGVGDGSLGCPPRRPINIPNSLVNHTRYDDWAPEIVHIMALQGFDGHFAIASPRILLFLLRSDERMKDGYETGCLSRAILSRDVQQVAYILDKHPSAIEETTIMGQTPFHLAASSPECLSLLLGAGETSLVDKRDLYRKTPLQWAMELSVEVCKNDPLDLYTLCHGCNCAECLIMLLEAGCTLSTESVLWTAVAWSTFRSTLEFAKHLKVRRETLKQLALEHLTPEQSSELGLYRPSVLDGKSLQAVEILESMKVPIRPNPAIRFDTDMADYYGATEESVYQILDDPYVAELFFQEGFRDLEECSDEGWLPLQSWNPRYINWLLEHGANINAPMQNLIYNGKKQRIHPIPVANTVAANVGRNYRRLMPAEMHAFQCILSVILTCRDIDRCHCACSDHGCSPFLHFLKTYFSKKKELPAIRSEFLRFLYRFGHLLGGDDVRCAIRFLTFQVTILSHTCCHHTWLSSSFEVDLTSEEAAEVHELETADLRRFENLVAELIEDFDKTVLGMPTTREILVDFFDNHWAKRVALALEEDVDNTVRFSVQKREAERLGVVWGPQEAQVCVYEPEKKYEYEYCIGLMDKIMAGEEVDIDRLWEED